jgi:CheY-like chemotaxis protein
LSRNLAPNVILLDMMMPEMDGWTFLGELRKDPLLSHVPVAVFTAHGDADDIAESVQAAACLKKPPTMEELLTTVEHLTAGQPPRP